MLILAILVVVSMPVGHATNNVHAFFTTATTVGTCGTLCKGLSTTSGTASTSTVETSLAIGSAPALDANANAVTSANWVSGTTFTVAGLSTNTATDTIIAIISNNGLVITVTGMSTPGITWDGSARTTLAPASCAMTATEWIGHTTATLSSVTTTITLSSTPTGASAQIAAFSGSEDPSGTFNSSDKAAGFASTNSQCPGGGSAPTGTSVTTLNANDMVVGFVVSSAAYTATAGTGYTLLGTATSAACGTGPGCSLGMEDQGVTATAAFNCAFTATVNRWIVICDALQSAPKYYKIEPKTSASLTGTPSTAANGFSGTGWVYNVAGIQNGLFDIQSGTWQIDLTGAVVSTTGTPVARYFVTAWSCTTNSCTTATFLWKNWDTATNVASSTTTTLRTYTTASQSQITWTSGNFLAFEVWVAWQYSGTTTTTTMTETTIDPSMDIKTPGWDSTESLSSTVTINSALTHVTNIFKSLSASVTINSALTHMTNIFKFLTGSLGLAGSETKGHTFYYGSASQTGCAGKCEQLVTTTGTADTTTSVKVGSSTTCCFQVQPDVGSTTTAGTPSSTTPSGYAWVFPTDMGGLTIQSGSWEFDTTITASKTGTANMRYLVWSCLTTSEGFCTLLFDFTGNANIEATTSATRITDVSPVEGPFSNVHFLTVEVWISPTVSTGSPSATDTMTTVSSASDVMTPAWGYSRSLTATVNPTPNLAEISSLFRSLTGSLGLAGSQVKGFAKSLIGSLSLVSSFTEKSSLLRSLTGSLGLAGSQVKGFAKSLIGSLSLVSSFTEKSSLLRSLTGSLGLAGSQVKGFAKSLIGSLSLASGFAEKSSLFRSLTGSLNSASSLADKASIFRSLSDSLTSSSSFVEKSSLFRSLTGSLGVAGSETKGLAKALSALMGLVSSFVEHSSLFRSLSSSLGLSRSELSGRTVTLTASIGSAPAFAGHSSLFRSLISSLTLTGSGTKALAETLSASLGSASSFAEHTSLFRTLTGSLGSASSLGERSSLFRTLTSSLGSASGLVEHTSLFRSLSGSLGLAVSFFNGRTEHLSASLGSASSFAEHTSLFRSLSSSLTLSGSETKGLTKALAGSIGSASGLVERTSLFRSLSGSLGLAVSFFNRSSVFLSASLGSASSFAEHTSLFRSLSSSLTLSGSETKGLTKALAGSIGSASGLVERTLLFRAL